MSFDPLDFQPNSVGVLVVRVIRLKDIMRTLDCTEARAHEVVREIRGETSADGAHAFVLPSQLAAWTYRRARAPQPGKESPLPFQTALLNEADVQRHGLAGAAGERGGAVSKESALREIRSDLRRLKAATIQPGALALTIEQAAARLGCAKTRVFELLKSGQLKRGKKVGKNSMVLVSSIDGLIKEVPAAGPRPTRAKAPARPETAAEILRKLRQQP